MNSGSEEKSGGKEPVSSFQAVSENTVHLSAGDGSVVNIAFMSTEFDAALTRAEALLRQVDQNRFLVGAVRGLQLLVPVVTLILLAAAEVGPADGIAAVLTAAVANIVFVAGLQVLLVVPLGLQIRRDRVAMVETVDALREQLGSIAAEGDWSRSTYRLNRLRIERFPL